MHALQSHRRDLNCEYTDRLEVGLVTDSLELNDAVRKFADYIQAETLATSLAYQPIAGVEPLAIKLAGHELTLYVKRLKGTTTGKEH